MAKDANVAADGSGFRATSLAYNARNRAEVDSVLKEAQAAGAKIVNLHKAFWGGYSAYFSDPDGFLWRSPGIHSSRSQRTEAFGFLSKKTF